jgi:hypothetical protein
MAELAAMQTMEVTAAFMVATGAAQATTECREAAGAAITGEDTRGTAELQAGPGPTRATLTEATGTGRESRETKDDFMAATAGAAPTGEGTATMAVHILTIIWREGAGGPVEVAATVVAKGDGGEVASRDRPKLLVWHLR